MVPRCCHVACWCHRHYCQRPRSCVSARSLNHDQTHHLLCMPITTPTRAPGTLSLGSWGAKYPTKVGGHIKGGHLTGHQMRFPAGPMGLSRGIQNFDHASRQPPSRIGTQPVAFYQIRCSDWRTPSAMAASHDIMLQYLCVGSRHVQWRGLPYLSW